MWADFVLHHATQDGWVPGLGDLNWCRRTFALIKEGGIWSCSAGVFRVWKSEQRVELVAVGHDSNLLERTRSIIWLMGWSYSAAPLDKSTECGKVQV